MSELAERGVSDNPVVPGITESGMTWEFSLDRIRRASSRVGWASPRGGLAQVDSTNIISLVNQIMIDEFEVDSGLITPDAQLGEDLGMDSLDGVDLVVALEKTFKCRIPEDEARSIRTMGDIYDRVENGLQKA